MLFSLSQHEAGCSPLEPCRTCNLAAFLRKELPPVKFAEFQKLCAGTKPIGYDTPLEQLYDTTISVRTKNCIHNDNIWTLGNLVRHKEAEMLRIPNFGYKSLNELKGLLASIGHSFGELPWEPKVAGGTDAS